MESFPILDIELSFNVDENGEIIKHEPEKIFDITMKLRKERNSIVKYYEFNNKIDHINVNEIPYFVKNYCIYKNIKKPGFVKVNVTTLVARATKMNNNDFINCSTDGVGFNFKWIVVNMDFDSIKVTNLRNEPKKISTDKYGIVRMEDEVTIKFNFNETVIINYDIYIYYEP